jgi:hypothetical protein
MSFMKFPRTMALLLGLAAFCSCSNLLGSKTSSSGSSASSSQKASLSAYGITAVTAKSAADPQPLGTKVASIRERKQIYFDGLNYASSTQPTLIDDNGGATTVKYTGSNSGWTTNPHVSIPARLGSNGKVSIVSIVFTPNSTSYTTGDNQGTVSVEVWDGTTLTQYTPSFSSTTFDLYLCGWGGNYYYQLNNEISAAAGDITGDGKDDIGFCLGNRFILLDGSNLSSVLYDGWTTGSGSADTDTTTMHPSRVAAGDIKGDGTIDFITTYGSAKANAVGCYKIYEGSTPSVIATGTLGGGTCPLTLMYANVALGDLDGDGRKEVIFAGRQDMSLNSCNVVAADWSSTSLNLSFWSSGYTIAVAGGDWAYNPIPPLVAFNPAVVTDTSTTYPETLLAWDNILTYSTSSTKFTQGYKGLMTIPRSVYTNVAAADVNYDNQDELISLSSVGGVGIEIYSFEGAAYAKTTIPAQVTSSGDKFMSVCTADLTGQSVVLQYLGTTVKYTNPQLIAVLASPPYYSDATSNGAFGNCGTSFGTSTGTTTSYSDSFTLSASFSIGVSVEAPLWGSVGSTEEKYTLGASFSYGFEAEKEVSYSHNYTTMAGNDAVIFSCIPFDVYSYKVLNSPNGSAVGTTITVDIPRTPQIIEMERSAFNALPSNTLSIGSSVLVHTLGIPSSYNNYTNISTLCNAASGGLIDPTGMTSPVGTGAYATSTVSLSQSKGTQLGAGLSYTASIQTVTAGVLFGAEVGFSDDFEYSVSTSKQTEISGSVPGINSTDKAFQFGIAGYNLTVPNLQSSPFMVVTYWVK